MFVFGTGPQFAPRNISISSVTSVPPRRHDRLSAQSDWGKSASASILLTWTGDAGKHGNYHIYLTHDAFQSTQRRRWREQTVSGQQNSTVLRQLQLDRVYFLLMAAQNRYGRSSTSPISVFRTARGETCSFLCSLPIIHTGCS